VEVRFQSAEPGERWAFEEFNRKSGDFAVAAVAVTLGLAGDAIDRVRVGVAGGGDRPLRAPRTEAELAGTPLADLDAAALGDAVADEVVPDGEREAAERRTLLAVLVRRALDRAANPERSRT
jgi:carbon-monoxide dehydrogenase medium subunit